MGSKSMNKKSDKLIRYYQFRMNHMLPLWISFFLNISATLLWMTFAIFSVASPHTSQAICISICIVFYIIGIATLIGGTAEDGLYCPYPDYEIKIKLGQVKYYDDRWLAAVFYKNAQVWTEHHTNYKSLLCQAIQEIRQREAKIARPSSSLPNSYTFSTKISPTKYKKRTLNG